MKEKNKVYTFWQQLLLILGTLSLLYGLFVIVRTSVTMSFHYIWILMGVICYSFCIIVRHYNKNNRRLSRLLILPIQIIVALGFGIFIIVQALIVAASKTVPPTDADYLVILGAKVNGTQPSRILQYRIDAAVEYLTANPRTKVIVCGGQGADEDISEAECMRQQLLINGIQEERIQLEDQSTSTTQNLQNAAAYLEQDKLVVITSTDFHLFRSIRIARKCGYTNVAGQAARSVAWLIPTNYTREFFAILKDFLMGNI